MRQQLLAKLSNGLRGTDLSIQLEVLVVLQTVRIEQVGSLTGGCCEAFVLLPSFFGQFEGF